MSLNLEPKTDEEVEESPRPPTMPDKDVMTLLGFHRPFLIPRERKVAITQGSFNDFDPLRTIDFLIKELQSKLYQLAPLETSLQTIIAEIQHSIIRLLREGDGSLPNEHRQRTAAYVEEVLERVNRYSQTPAIDQAHISTQTDAKYQFLRQLQRDLELSYSKLKLDCKNLREEGAKIAAERNELKETSNIQLHTIQIMKAEAKHNKAIMESKTTQIEILRRELNRTKEALQEKDDLLQAQIARNGSPQRSAFRKRLDERNQRLPSAKK